MSAAEKPTAQCECCAGTGRRPLSRAEAATLPHVGAAWTSTNAINDALPDVKRTTLCVRLSRMEQAGLIESRDTSGPAGFKNLKEWRRRP